MGGSGKAWAWYDRALALSGGASVFVGLLLIFATGSVLFDAYDASVAKAFYGSTALPEAVVRHHNWLMGVIGSSVVGWGLAFLALVVWPFRRRELWAWRTLSWSVGIWCLLDIGVSLVHGVGSEVVFVGAFALVVAVPLGFSRAAFVDA